MTTAVDVSRLLADAGPKVTLAGPQQVLGAGAGTAFSGFSSLSSVYVEAQVQLVRAVNGQPSLVLLVEHSDDGNSWSTAETFTYGGDATQTATLSSPKNYMRASWTVGNRSEWYIRSVVAALGAAGGTGSITFPSQTTGQFLYATDGSTGLGWTHPLDIIDAATEFGVVTTGSADNTTALAAAIAAAPYAVSGLSGNDVPCREVKLPPGRCNIQPDAITCPPNLTLSGHGRSASYLKIIGASTGVGIGLGSGSVQVTLRDFGMISQGNHDVISFIQSAGASITDANHVLENLLVVGGGRAVLMAGNTENRIVNVFATRQSPADGQGVFHINCTDAMIANCTASAIQSAGGTTASCFYLACDNTRVVNCKAFGPAGLVGSLQSGFWLSGSRSIAVALEVQDFPGNGMYFGGEWVLQGGLIDSCGGSAVLFAGGGNVVRGLKVLGNRGGGAYTVPIVLNIPEDSSLVNDVEVIATGGPTQYFQNGAKGYFGRYKLNAEGSYTLIGSINGTITPDPLAGTTYGATLTGNLTLAAPSPFIANALHVGTELVFLLTQDGTGGRTVTLNSAYVVPNYVDTGNAAGKFCSIRVVYDGAKWVGSSSGWTAPAAGGGSSLAPTAVKTSGYTASAGDLVPCDVTGGTFAVTLPTAPTDKTQVAVEIVAQTAAAPKLLTVVTGGSDVFNKTSGPTTAYMGLLNATAVFQYNSSGAIWYCVSPGATLPPSFEFGYDEITSNINITSTTEATGTSLIAAAAHNFDGSPVIAHFFAPTLANGSSGGTVTVNLFESSTQIGRLAATGSGAQMYPALNGFLRFTPTAGAHTYTVTAFTSNATGPPSITAGAKGTGAYDPAFIRFLKA